MKNQKFRFKGDTAIFMIAFHIAALSALYYYDHFYYLLLAVVYGFIAHCLGLALCFHRLLVHRGFQTPKFIEYVLTVFGFLTFQSGHIKWVAIHRLHHQYTDLPQDPHSPRQGFLHAHILWMINGDGSLASPKFLQRYAPDLCKDEWHVFLNKYWAVPSLVVALGLFFWGGLPAVLWIVLVPIVCGWHFTWLVNSACHRWGTRRFETDDDSTNNWIVALLTWGEGWHNNHHDQPARARHGLSWREPDIAWMCIRAMMLVNLATDVNLKPSKAAEAKALALALKTPA